MLFLFRIVTAFFPGLKSKTERSAPQRIAGLQAAILFVLTFVFGPLAFQLLMINGWKTTALFLFQALTFVPTVPLFAQAIREHNDRRENARRYFSDAMRKWNNYCENILGEDKAANDPPERFDGCSGNARQNWSNRTAAQLF